MASYRYRKSACLTCEQVRGTTIEYARYDNVNNLTDLITQRIREHGNVEILAMFTDGSLVHCIMKYSIKTPEDPDNYP